MPKFYCEYCDLYLTHSGISGRRQHLTGRRHINNKIEYYQTLIKEKGLTPPIYPPPPGMCLPVPALKPGGQPMLPGMPGGGGWPLGLPPGMPPGLMGLFMSQPGGMSSLPGLPGFPGLGGTQPGAGLGSSPGGLPMTGPAGMLGGPGGLPNFLPRPGGPGGPMGGLAMPNGGVWNLPGQRA